MLPRIKAPAISLVTALAIAVTTAAPAQAWGQREQDTLKGAVGALLLKAIIDDARRDRAPSYYHAPAPQPRYYQGHGYAKPKPAPSIYTTPAARAFNSYSLSQRYRIQRQLAHWGYYRGGIDGRFGPGTYSAVAAFARDRGQGLGSTARAFGVYDGLLY